LSWKEDATVLRRGTQITVGVLAGVIRAVPSVGLLYFDGDLDLNTPKTTPSGILDGMVMSHIIGNGVERLSRIGPRYPLMDKEDITLFGFNTEAGWIDPLETRILENCRMAKYPLSGIRGSARGSAEEALINA